MSSNHEEQSIDKQVEGGEGEYYPENGNSNDQEGEEYGEEEAGELEDGESEQVYPQYGVLQQNDIDQNVELDKNVIAGHGVNYPNQGFNNQGHIQSSESQNGPQGSSSEQQDDQQLDFHEPSDSPSQVQENSNNYFQNLLAMRAMNPPTQNYGEVYIKRQFFKAARQNKVDVLEAAIEKIPDDQNVAQYLQKRDPEGRNVVTLCLLFASVDVLKALHEICPGNEEFILNQNYDYNPSMHMALGLAAFTQYRERSLETTRFLMSLMGASSAQAQQENGGSSLQPLDPNMTRFCNIQDRLGRTCLHVACQHGIPLEIIQSLIQVYNANPRIEDIEGQTPLHYAVDFDREHIVGWFLHNFDVKECVENGLRRKHDINNLQEVQDNPEQIEAASKESNIYYRAITKRAWRACLSIQRRINNTAPNQLEPGILEYGQQLAESCGYGRHLNIVKTASRNENQLAYQQNIVEQLKTEMQSQIGSSYQTLVITDQFLLKHAGFENYANVGERVMQKESQPENAERLMVLIDKEKGVLTKANELLDDESFTLKTVAEPAKLADVLKVHDYRYIKDVIRKCAALENVPDTHTLGKYDRDCMISSETWTAALMASGAVLEACDKVMSGEWTNAFCAIRPPGHHAGVFGKTFRRNVCDQEQTNGFCYINNVAVAAAYLLNNHRKHIKRVAIVDFDVHHGNGTQEIIECMQKPKVFKEQANTSILYDSDPRVSTQYRPWLDDNDGKNVLFHSVHLDGLGFYPGTGAEDHQQTLQQQEYYPGGIVNLPLAPGSASSAQWRKVISEKLIPRLVEFKPDIILISAGFDAHEKDHIHSSGDTQITEFEYQWLTNELIKVANQFSKGRIISVLEGGYSTKSGPISPLAQSVLHHVRALLKANKQTLDSSVNLDGQQQIQANSDNELDIDLYLQQAKKDRQILKRRRNNFNQELQEFGFQRIMNLRKRQRQEPDQAQQEQVQPGAQQDNKDDQIQANNSTQHNEQNNIIS